jgi:hypothetical protein
MDDANRQEGAVGLLLEKVSLDALRPWKSTKLATTSDDRNPSDKRAQRIFAIASFPLESVSE